MEKSLEVVKLVLQRCTDFDEKEVNDPFRLACSLLATSADTARIVHEACTGKLHLRLGPVKQTPQLARAYCCWFSKHARLLRILELDNVARKHAAAVLAGLQAATSAPADSIRAAWRQLASNAATAAPVGPGGALPLAELSFGRSSSTSYQADMLECLRDSPGLTSLQLALPNEKGKCKPLATALAGLTHLQKLSLSPGMSGSTAYVSCLTPDIGRMLQLTELHCCSGVLLSTRDVKELPISLVKLSISNRMGQDGGPGKVHDHNASDEIWPDPPHTSQVKGINLSALTHLTELSWYSLLPTDKLPDSLLQLTLDTPYSIHPVLHLNRLQLLHIKNPLLLSRGHDVEALGALARLSKLPQLTQVTCDIEANIGTLYCGGEFSPWDSRVLASTANALPHVKGLQHLRLEGFFIQPKLVLHLGSCSQLTSLVLARGELDDDNESWNLSLSGAEIARHFELLAEQLQKLTNLQHLQLSLAAGCVPEEELEGKEQPVEVSPVLVQPVVDAISSLAHLASLQVQFTTVTQGSWATPGPYPDLLADAQKAQLRAVVPGALLQPLERMSVD